MSGQRRPGDDPEPVAHDWFIEHLRLIDRLRRERLDGAAPRPDPADALDLTWLTMVEAALSPEAINEAVRTYPQVQDGVVRHRRRAFGLNEEHLHLLELCATPRSVLELADLLGPGHGARPARGGTAPAGAGAVDLRRVLPPEVVAEIVGPGDRPVGLVKALINDLYVEGLVRVEEPAPDFQLADPALYRALVTALDGLGR